MPNAIKGAKMSDSPKPFDLKDEKFDKLLLWVFLDYLDLKEFRGIIQTWKLKALQSRKY